MAGEEASLVKQLLACFTMYTLSMSIGAGAGFSGVVNPQVRPLTLQVTQFHIKPVLDS